MKVAAVPVTILSVDATPINPEPSPTKLVAVITPALPIFILPPTSKKSFTLTDVEVVTPDMIRPFCTVGAQSADWFVI